MTQHMRRHPRRLNAASNREHFELLAKSLPGEMPVRRRKQPGRSPTSLRVVRIDGGTIHIERLTRGIVQWNQTLPAALARDRQHAVVGREHGGPKRDQLRHPQARGVERLQQGVEAKRTQPRRSVRGTLSRFRRRLQQPLDLRQGQNFGKRASKFRAVNGGAGVVRPQPLRQKKAEELTDGGELSRARCGGKPFSAEPRQKCAHHIRASAPRIRPLGGKKGKKGAQVACIGLDRLRGGATLSHEHVEKERQLGVSIQFR